MKSSPNWQCTQCPNLIWTAWCSFSSQSHSTSSKTVTAATFPNWDIWEIAHHAAPSRPAYVSAESTGWQTPGHREFYVSESACRTWIKVRVMLQNLVCVYLQTFSSVVINYRDAVNKSTFLTRLISAPSSSRAVCQTTSPTHKGSPTCFASSTVNDLIVLHGTCLLKSSTCLSFVGLTCKMFGEEWRGDKED